MAELYDAGAMLGSQPGSLHDPEGGRNVCATTLWRKDQISRSEDADRLFLFCDNEDGRTGCHHEAGGLIDHAIILDKLYRPCHDCTYFDIIGLQPLGDHLLDDVGRRHEPEVRLR